MRLVVLGLSGVRCCRSLGFVVCLIWLWLICCSLLSSCSVLGISMVRWLYFWLFRCGCSRMDGWSVWMF